MGGRVRRVMVIGAAVAAVAAIGGTALAHESDRSRGAVRRRGTGRLRAT
jgi:hypothetical protein